jgi:hypothetical protein
MTRYFCSPQRGRPGSLWSVPGVIGIRESTNQPVPIGTAFEAKLDRTPKHGTPNGDRHDGGEQTPDGESSRQEPSEVDSHQSAHGSGMRETCPSGPQFAIVSGAPPLPRPSTIVMPAPKITATQPLVFPAPWVRRGRIGSPGQRV